MAIAESECNGELEKQIEDAMQPPKKSGGVIGFVHMGLDGLGMVPVVQDVANPINGLIYIGQGDWVNAGLSFGGMIPVAGDGFIVARNAAKGIKDVNVARGIVRDGRDAEQILGDAGKIERGAGRRKPPSF